MTYFLEHLDYLLLQQKDPIIKAKLFGLLFNKLPTYGDLISGTPEFVPVIELNQLFQQRKLALSSLMAGDEGFEPPILGPEPSALPLGQSPLRAVIILSFVRLG